MTKTHVPVLAGELIELIDPHPGEVAVDCTVGGGGQTLRLTGDQLVPGVAVSGTIRLTAAADPLEGQSVIAQLAANAPGVHGASFTAGWNTQGAQAQVVGTVGGEPVAGTMPAP